MEFYMSNRDLIKGLSLNTGTSSVPAFTEMCTTTEVTFNNLLNPAIITACQNLDQLDVYLDCLSSNKLDKFNYFKVS